MALFRSLLRAASTRESLHAIAAGQVLSPAQRLEQVVAFINQYVTDTHGDTNMFTTLLVCLLNSHDGQVVYINCGNEPALWLRDGSLVALLPPTGMCLGILPEAVFTAKEITLLPGDLLVTYSDGITDAMNSADEPFGWERLLVAIQVAESSPVRLVDEIASQVNQYAGPAEQFDDITLLAIRKS